MSLKAFHIFFIVTALALLAFVTVWSGERVAQGLNSGSLAIAIASGLAFAAGVPYLGWFLRKSRSYR